MLKGLVVNGVLHLITEENLRVIRGCVRISRGRKFRSSTHITNRPVGVEVLTILLSKVDIQARMVDATNRQIVTIQSVTSVDRQIIVSVKRVLPATAYSSVVR